ncbi:hypothetical protein [Cribrihabitans neustonicus]|uniref:hypothetical protein n=1 Tax=Cribrihabitans neustonicus TaxID=1429085 RepID=UPI003B5B13B0
MTVIGAGGFGYAQAAARQEQLQVAADAAAPLLQGRSQGLARALARDAALNPAQAAGALPQPRQPGGSASAGAGPQSGTVSAPGSMAEFFLDLASGTQAGPKPASALAAEAAYRAACKATG